MRNRRRSRKPYLKFWQRGFTLIETLVIVALVGILAAIATPSFGALLEAMQVDQTVANLRTSLQDTQRQAIRTSQVCSVQVPIIEVPIINGNGKSKRKGKNTSITGNCLTSGSPELSEAVDLISNLQTSNSTSSEGISIQFSALGSANFSITSAVQPPAIPSDPTGKVVAFIGDKPQLKKKCVAISATLGLTRVGTYTGGTTPVEITDQGVCTALDWKRQ